MALADEVNNAATAAAAAGGSALSDDDVQSVVAEGLAEGESGGIAGLLEKFKAGGLGEVFESWIGTGENKGISGNDIKAALEPEKLQAMAGKLGITPDMAADKLAGVLPGVIDKLTPDGLVPDPDALSAKLTGFIKERF